MTPEYGCTATFFPPDAVTLCQLDTFGRTKAERSLARAYLEAQNLLADAATPVFRRSSTFDSLVRSNRRSPGPSGPTIGSAWADFRPASGRRWRSTAGM